VSDAGYRDFSNIINAKAIKGVDVILQRTLYNKLLQWRKSATRRPLLLQGARQTGKSYLLEHFAKNEFANLFLFNFEKKPGLRVEMELQNSLA